MNQYLPRLSVKQRPCEARDKQTGIFVNMPDGADYNIWSVPIKWSKDEIFLNAIASAFKRGWEAAMMFHSQLSKHQVTVSKEVEYCDKESY